MTTRLKGLTIALNNDIREDDAECIINAIKMIKGVQEVNIIESNPDDWIIEQRIKQTISEKMWEVLK